MKNILVAILSVMMAVSLAVTGFAASFVSSPSGNSAPTVDSFDFEDDSCVADIQVTPYSQRNTLSPDVKDAIEGAYDEIKATNDVSSLNADLAALAASKEIKGKNLAVSDLFDVSGVGCGDHGDHDKVTISLKAETLDNFVGLLHLVDGEWELVSNATVSGDVLTFTVDSLSPFAIVVDATPDSPPTGDNGNVYLLVAVAALSLVAALICFKKARKEEN